MFDRNFLKNDPFFPNDSGFGRVDSMFSNMRDRMKKMMSEAHSR